MAETVAQADILATQVRSILNVTVRCPHRTCTGSIGTRPFGICPIFGSPTIVINKIRHIIHAGHIKFLKIDIQHVITLCTLQEETECPVLPFQCIGYTILVIRVGITYNLTVSIINYRIVIKILVFHFTYHAFNLRVRLISIQRICTDFGLIVIKAIFHIPI